MRKEYIEYMKDLPIKMHLANIMEYPLHWKDSIEILYVIKGTINVQIETEIYTLKEREIEIVNANEIYSLKSEDEDNLVLILNIDPNFFERYYDGAKEMFFYTNSLDDNVQEGEKYHILRRYISILLYESVSKIDDYEDEIEDTLLKLMYHLLNNFHYLFYEEESLREDEVQLERYHRIIKYLSNNYMNKVSLQEIADKEFLSSQYLSYKIKDTFGQSFNDFLNGIRVEESRKLLLDTDKNILEISEEVGFSHVRYYNKHFKNHYECSPMEYRKKHKVTEEELDKMKRIKYYPRKDALEYLKSFLEDYERYDYDNKITKIYIDLDKESEEEFKIPDLIDLGDISLLLEEENRRALEKIQSEIGFKYCIVDRLFSDDMDIYKGKNNRFINWTRVENILELLRTMKLTPIIVTDGIEEYIIEDFTNHFSNIFDEDEVEGWLNNSRENLKSYLPKDLINPVQDTLTMVPYIFYNYIHLDKRIVLNMIDEITKETLLDNETFFGDRGIVTSNYLYKPSYYGYMLLCLLGDELLYKGDGYIATKSDEGYQILLFNPTEIEEEIIYGNLEMGKVKDRKVSLNLLNMEGDYQITKYELNKEFGSIYDKWLSLGSPERLDNDHWELLEEFVHPHVSFHYGRKSIVYNLVSTIKPYGAILFCLNSVQNDENQG